MAEQGGAQAFLQVHTCECKMEHLVDGSKERKFCFEDETVHKKDGDV